MCTSGHLRVLPHFQLIPSGLISEERWKGHGDSRYTLRSELKKKCILSLVSHRGTNHNIYMLVCPLNQTCNGSSYIVGPVWHTSSTCTWNTTQGTVPCRPTVADTYQQLLAQGAVRHFCTLPLKDTSCTCKFVRTSSGHLYLFPVWWCTCIPAAISHCEQTLKCIMRALWERRAELSFC